MSTATVTNPLDYMGAVKTTTRTRASEVVKATQAKGHKITHVWGYDPDKDNPEHHSGYAADFMVFSDKAGGDFVATYLWANRKRLRVKHIIWRQRIISTVKSPGVWRKMEDRGNPTANHMDHVHVLFLPPLTKPPTTPAVKYPGPVYFGNRGPKVATWQRALNTHAGTRLAVDSSFGPKTLAAVKAVQRRYRLVVDGKAGPATWKALTR